MKKGIVDGYGRWGQGEDGRKGVRETVGEGGRNMRFWLVCVPVHLDCQVPSEQFQYCDCWSL